MGRKLHPRFLDLVTRPFASFPVNAERADVMTNQMGKSRGFGTVMFATPEEAERAIGALNGYNFQGRVIEVREDRNAPAGGSAGASGAGASSGE